MSIRSILLLIIGALTLMITLLAAGEMYGSMQRLARVTALRDASLLSNQLFDATERISVERDVALSMLHAPDPDTAADLKQRLAASRRAADDAMGRSMAAFDHYAFPELVPLRDAVRKHLELIRSLRLKVDAAADAPDSPEKRALAQRWSDEVTGLILETQNLWIGFIRHFTDIDPIVTQNLWVKHFARTITDYTGRERSLIGQLIVENADPTPKQISQLLYWRGVTEESWQMTRVLAQQSGLYAKIAPYYTDAYSHYSTMHDMIRDMFYVPGARHGGNYPISVDLWFELSTEASDSLSSLRGALIFETRKYVQGLIDDTRNQIAGQLVTFLIALILCVSSFRVILRRVIRPVNGMVDALVKATHGERAEFTLPINRGDEIGKLAEVLQAFHENLERIKSTAAELDRSESRLRAVVDHTLDGLITIDTKGMIKTFNHACERIFDYDASEVVGRNVKMLMPEPYHAEHDGYLARYKATGDAHIIGTAGREVTGRRKDGSVFPMDLSISVFTLEDGTYYSGIVRDITLRKEAEQELMGYTHALERSNKELDDFAYIASHDLKEPLRGIHNHSRFLLEDNEEKLDTESVGRLNRLVFLSQRMERLVNDLLYFSRLGRQELAVQPTEIGAVIDDVESTLDHFLEERSARIVMPLALPTIVCDKPRVTELFRNLITNAAKYNDKAEKIIEIGFLDSMKTADGAAMKNVFYVKDNGLGIVPEFHQEIFRIFKRLQAAQGPEEGTGVGLTFVKKIVERHGGQIWLESEPGKGTTFYFTLEASKNDSRHESKAAA
ncbi:MAG TPA: PAS domain S-box protein [Rhizomicrobium sp.]